MRERDLGDPLHCSWCDKRFGTARAVMDCEHEHAEADRRMRLREVRPASEVLASRLEDAAAGGLVNGPTTEVVQ